MGIHSLKLAVFFCKRTLTESEWVFQGMNLFERQRSQHRSKLQTIQQGPRSNDVVTNHALKISCEQSFLNSFTWKRTSKMKHIDIRQYSELSSTMIVIPLLSKKLWYMWEFLEDWKNSWQLTLLPYVSLSWSNHLHYSWMTGLLTQYSCVVLQQWLLHFFDMHTKPAMGELCPVGCGRVFHLIPKFSTSESSVPKDNIQDMEVGRILGRSRGRPARALPCGFWWVFMGLGLAEVGGGLSDFTVVELPPWIRGALLEKEASCHCKYLAKCNCWISYLGLVACSKVLTAKGTGGFSYLNGQSIPFCPFRISN